MSGEKGSQQRQEPEPQEIVAGRYQLTRMLARGGMGEVFSAIDQSTGRPVALKRLHASARTQRGVVVHFMREYHALSELRHPRIIEVYDYGVDHDVPYYTMELLDGQDLRDLSPLPYREACLYLRDVASSLALLHARRLLHRDVSPRNVRRTSDGHCKLIDFGAMIAFGVPPNVSGTAPCIPPEALQGASLDQRTDLYSLGALAYCVLTGRHGYEVAQLDQLRDAWQTPLVRPKHHVRDLPEALDELVMSLLSLDPMKRPKSAAEVIDWLSAVGELPSDDVAGAARSFLTSSRLCGRGLACEEMTRRLQRGFEGRGSAILVAGVVGSGKSRMLAEAGLIAQTCGLRAARVVARRQRGAAYAVAQDLVAALQQIAPTEAKLAGAERIEWPRALGLVGDLANAERDVSEARARLQQELSSLFCRVARAQPLLLTVDDLDRADEFSVALLASLALQARELPLVIVSSQTEGSSEPQSDAVQAFRSAASCLHLSELSQADSGELVQSMFGNVPNLMRLTDWMFRVARGNPKLTIELAEHLLKRGLVRYVEGTWVLPSDEIREGVPQDMAEAWVARIQALSPVAVALAELLCVRRGGASAERCLAAGAASAEHVFGALDELVREGVLESAGDEYAFAQDALRKTLQRGLTPERAGLLHRRWADMLLAESAPDIDAQLEAGWHLIHTDDELRGADLLARVAPVLVEQGLAMSTAIPAIEKALAVYERLKRPLEIRLRLRSTLVLVGYLYDYRLAALYGKETLAALHLCSGVALAERMSRWAGARAALILAMFLTSVRRLWLPPDRRGPPTRIAMKYFVRSAMGLLGVRAVGLDAAGTSEILKLVAPLAGAPSMSSGRVVYLSCRAIALQILGREGDTDRAVRAALTELRRGRRQDMTELEYQNLLIGLLTSDGQNECYREGSQALQRADVLDAIGSRQAQAAALRIRMTYYLRRGDTDRAEQCRRAIDLHAIQGGKTWQVEWFAVPLEGMSGATWSDLVMMRRSLDRLEQLIVEVPSLATMRDSIGMSYSFRRGDLARAVRYGERYKATNAPRTLIGWAATYAMLALTYAELGQPERAREICEEALAHVTEADRAYFVMYSLLDVAYATALALLGERKRAEAILDAQFERLRTHGEHVTLVLMYQHRARMARLVSDRSALLQSLQSMRTAALTSGFPAVILLADRVAELRVAWKRPPSPHFCAAARPAQRAIARRCACWLAGWRRTRRTCSHGWVMTCSWSRR
jgi:tetratricopeptide (TPR) repeat protein